MSKQLAEELKAQIRAEYAKLRIPPYELPPYQERLDIPFAFLYGSSKIPLVELGLQCHCLGCGNPMFGRPGKTHCGNCPTVEGATEIPKKEETWRDRPPML